MNPFNSPTPNFDNLLLHSLTPRSPHLRPPPPPPPLEHLLLNNLNLSDTDSDQEDSSSYSSKSQLAKEEANLEKEIIRKILAGESDALKPNSGQAVSIGEHHICVGFHQESGSVEYRVWEWHGHIMLFDEENGYSPEYIYGNYFEWIKGKEEMKKEKIGNVVIDDDNDHDEKEEDEIITNFGLKDLIESGEGESNGRRILHRNINAGSPRF